MIRIHTRDGRNHETASLTLADVTRVFSAAGGIIVVRASTRDDNGNSSDVRDVLIPAHAVDFIEEVAQ